MLRSLLVLGCAGAALAASGYAKFDLQRESVQSLRKRDVPNQDLGQIITLGSNQSLYWLNLSIGTPPQPFRLQLDTGSSNLLVPNSNDAKCVDKCPSGSFTPDDSSTFSLVEEGTFQISYGDGTAYVGDYFSDVVTVGDIVIKAGDMDIGLANQLQDGPQLENDGTGLVGVGYQANAQGPSGAKGLPNTIISAMVASGDIEREAYSLYLDTKEDGLGSIIFGGVDSSKYTGDLVALQILQTPLESPTLGTLNYTAFNVALTGISVVDASGKTTLLTDSSFAVPALLDSGTTSQNIPSDIFQQISKGLGLAQNGGIPCGYADSSLTIVYSFGGDGGPSISVPLRALMDTQPQDAWTFDDGSDACALYMSPVNPELGVILGDSMMRSGYFVYDLENNLAALAQAAPNATEESITAISSGTDIPGCTSTNTFSVAALSPPTAAATTEAAPTTGNVPGTPTFDLGVSLQTAGGSGSETGSSSNAAAGGKSVGLGFAAAMSLVALAMAL